MTGDLSRSRLLVAAVALFVVAGVAWWGMCSMQPKPGAEPAPDPRSGPAAPAVAPADADTTRAPSGEDAVYPVG